MIRSYIICATPRTGSTLLCDMLRRTGVAGQPDSFYREVSVDAWAREWGLAGVRPQSDAAFNKSYHEAALREGEGRTGVFGMRLMRENVRDMSARLGTLYPALTLDRPRIEAALGPTAYIHLSRSDKVRQAVSYVKATQTGLWHMAPDGTELERLKPPQEPVYDFDEIQRTLLAFERYDAEWPDWFTAHNIDPHHVTYEAIASDPAIVLAGILDHLGLDPRLADGMTPGVAKLADQISDDWVARFHADSTAKAAET